MTWQKCMKTVLISIKTHYRLWPRGNSHASGRTNQMANPEFFSRYSCLQERSLWPRFCTVSCFWETQGSHSVMQVYWRWSRWKWHKSDGNFRDTTFFLFLGKWSWLRFKTRLTGDDYLLKKKNAGLQHLNDELLSMVSWAFQLRARDKSNVCTSLGCEPGFLLGMMCFRVYGLTRAKERSASNRSAPVYWWTLQTNCRQMRFPLK